MSKLEEYQCYRCNQTMDEDVGICDECLDISEKRARVLSHYDPPEGTVTVWTVMTAIVFTVIAVAVYLLILAIMVI